MTHAQRHLRFQVLLACTLAIGLVPVISALTIASGLALAGTLHGWTVAMYLFAAGGTLLAASAFDRGEPMRPAWLLLSVSYLVLIPQRFYNGPKAAGLYEAAVPSAWASSFASTVSGVLAVAGFLLLSSAWRSSGLDQSSRMRRVGMQLTAFAIAGVLAGPDVVDQLPAAFHGDIGAAGNVLTDLLDVALFIVAVPVLRAALGLGGGLVAWPWIILTASLAAWLGYDATDSYAGAAGLDPRTVRIIEEVCRTLGAALAGAAGVAQRWVMTEAE
jgi:hypothetical protein